MRYITVFITFLFFLSCSNFYPAWVSTSVAPNNTFSVIDTVKDSVNLTKYSLKDTIIDTVINIDSSFVRSFDIHVNENVKMIALFDSMNTNDFEILHNDESIEFVNEDNLFFSKTVLDTGIYSIKITTSGYRFLNIMVYLAKEDTVTDNKFGDFLRTDNIRLISNRSATLDTSIFYTKFTANKNDSIIGFFEGDSNFEFKICNYTNFKKYLMGLPSVTWIYSGNSPIDSLSMNIENSAEYTYLVINKSKELKSYKDSLIIIRK